MDFSVLRRMKVGEVCPVTKVFPGVTDEPMKMCLTDTVPGGNGCNYMVEFSFMGVFMRKAVFYDYKGEMIEVRQTK